MTMEERIADARARGLGEDYVKEIEAIYSTMPQANKLIHQRIDRLVDWVVRLQDWTVEEFILKTKTNDALCDAVSDLRKNMAYLEVALCIVTGIAVVSLLLALEVLK